MIKIPMQVEPTAIGTLPVEPSFPLSGSIKYRKENFESQGGDFISKSLSTKPDETYEFSWQALSKSERDTLVSFIDAHIGPLESFLWQNTRWHFTDNELRISIVNPDVYDISISVEKIPDLCPVSKPTGGP